jgi:hypothetical protein
MTSSPGSLRSNPHHDTTARCLEHIEEFLRAGRLGFIVVTPVQFSDGDAIAALVEQHLPPGAGVLQPHGLFIHVFLPGAGLEEIKRWSVQFYREAPDLIRHVTGAAAKPGDPARDVLYAAEVLTQVGGSVACTDVVKSGWYDRADYWCLEAE